MLKPFLRRSQKSQWKENYTVATLWKPIRSGLDRFFSGSLQRKPFSIIRDYKVHKPANEALNPKDLARQELISFTKHKRPISSEDLEVLYAANQLGLNAPESFANSEYNRWMFVRNSLTPFSTSEREAVKTNERWNPVTFSSKQKAGWTTSSQARERRKISPPSSAPDFTHSAFHGCKFRD